MPVKGRKKVASSNDISFEDAVEKLDSIVEEMESDDLPLDKMLVSYEEGAKLVKLCEEKLKAAETRITQLEENLEGELATRSVTFREETN
jgi:exodeoxyribonuclease VII small subunit